MPSPFHGYRWLGMVTADEWIWDLMLLPYPAPELPRGVDTLQLVLYYKGRGPGAGEVDSVALGTYAATSIVAERGSMGAPLGRVRVSAPDPGGFVWSAWNDEYRLVKQTLRGDTVIVVALPPAPVPYSREELADAAERVERFMEQAGRVPVDYDELLPRYRPAMEGLSVDDEGRLWVTRLDAEGHLLFDVFSPDGVYLAVAHCDCAPDPHFVPTVRGTSFFTVERDVMKLPHVIRARIDRH
jgi:hypothetical protein